MLAETAHRSVFARMNEIALRCDHAIDQIGGLAKSTSNRSTTRTAASIAVGSTRGPTDMLIALVTDQE